MKFYLSSYKLGDVEAVEKLKKILPENKRTAYISNGLDFSNDLERRKISENSDIEQLTSIGLEVENFDLRNYFNKQESIEKDLSQYGVIWVRGGNAFVLRQAMSLSGFDKALKNLMGNKEMLYGGYSAGIVVLGPNLHGIEMVDDSSKLPYPDQQDVIWEGLGLVEKIILPHYKSNHPESNLIDLIIERYNKDNTPFIALKDGEALIL